jgi:hypothetical protein
LQFSPTYRYHTRNIRRSLRQRGARFPDRNFFARSA